MLLIIIHFDTCFRKAIIDVYVYITRHYYFNNIKNTKNKIKK